MTVAFAGERGAFAELAAVDFFGEKSSRRPVPAFEDVFLGVAQGRYRCGVVPIENSLAGSIHQNYDLLLESGLFIQAEILLRIRHCLIANPGTTMRRVRRIFSHPAAFPQCRSFLKKLPAVELIDVSTTAAAVKMILEEGLRDAAAIASLQAANDFSMRVLARDIEDRHWNTTRFLVVSRKAAAPRPGTPCKSSLVFSTRNIPGALHRCLGAFATRGIDLYKIESRPVRGSKSGFRYQFYLDFAGDSRARLQASAIAELRESTSFCRILGTYPVDKPRDPKYRLRRTPK